MSNSQRAPMWVGRISQPYALLLLPPPSSLTFPDLKATYGSTLSKVLLKLAKSLDGANRIAILDVGVTIPGALSPKFQPRARLFANLQYLLANLYTLIGAICAAEKIELDGPGGIDIRIFFVDNDPKSQASSPANSSGSSILGPIIDLQTLVTCGRSWDAIYTLNSKQTQDLAVISDNIFSSSHGRSQLPPISTVSDSEASSTLSEAPIAADTTHSGPHYSVAVGGTFDHLHIGHKLLLTATALAIDPVPEGQHIERLMTIGVTGDELLVNKKYAEFLESWDERSQSCAAFLAAIMDFSVPEKSARQVEQTSNPEPNGKYTLTKVSSDLSLKLVQISDPFGPTITDKEITALVVSKETRSGGKAVNDERAKKQWPALEIFEVDVLQTGEVAETEASSVETFESKISSTDIRRRRMDMAKGNL
ncbi:pantetheine-phosphate adenylyltransferase family protein [Paecilomyces variotii No. 5]|uniref:Pantetheine-phosphate adenylyltransferase family protein n=1 Tax=Byssochlamys spectabilis (strain No. 5 / NBRC 109023) TaxID=1356009 RepID=V5FY13_BYSSN|nr:pantetheine-phosphate adenylyltransferase family protein [Paecilomyces variotii No. 5]